METTNDAASGGGERVPVVAHTAAGEGTLSLRDAANSLRSWRRRGSPPERHARAASARAASDHATASDTAQAHAGTDTGGNLADDRAVSLRDLRERTADDIRDDTRSDRRARDTPDGRRVDTDRADADHADISRPGPSRDALLRQQAAQALPLYAHALQTALAGEFPDIRTRADVARLAQREPQRFARWQALSGELTGAGELVAAEHTSQQTRRQLDAYRAKEGERLKAHLPETDDEAQWGRLRSSAVAMLKKLDYGDAELAALWNGHRTLSIHDHRFQRLLRDAVRWHELQNGEAAVVPESAQAPRTVHVRSEEARARLRDLGQELERTRGLNAVQAAADLLAERRRATRFR